MDITPSLINSITQQYKLPKRNPKKIKIHQCEKCGKTFAYPYRLKRHQNSKTKRGCK